jgi:hypothetical protein
MQQLNNDGYQDHDQMLENARGQQAKEKPKFQYALHAALALSAFILLWLGCWSWNHHDVSGQCQLFNSGERYIYQSSLNGACNNVTTMVACIKNVCQISYNPVFGQCYAGPLAISTGSFGLAAALAGVLLKQPYYKTFNSGTVGLFIIATVGCGIAASVLSFYHWGEQRDAYGHREDRAVFEFGGDSCKYTYSDARGDYKALTAFGFLTAIVAVITGACEAVHWSGVTPLARQQSMPEPDLFL